MPNPHPKTQEHKDKIAASQRRAWAQRREVLARVAEVLARLEELGVA
jgi:hypothetical protein